MRSTSHSDDGPPTAAADDPRLAVAVRLLHRRRGWSVTAFCGLFTFLLGFGAYQNAVSAGTPPPTWFADLIIAPAALTVASLAAVAVDSQRLRRLPAVVRDAATVTVRHHPARAHAHRYPPRHHVSWVFLWVGMALLLFTAVVCFPGVVDGIGYLAGAGKHGTFTGQSYDQVCGRYSCQTETEGILTTGGTTVSTSWPDQVPLGQSFPVREPIWNWGVGGSLIDGDGTAVAAILVSLFLDAAAIFVLVLFVKMVRNWLRHRRQVPNT